jgi:hypothetical protein
MEYPWVERGPATTLSAPEAAAVLVAAHRAVTSSAPTLARAELELAHAWGLETNRSRGMWRYNWGNISAGGFVQRPEGPVEVLRWKGDVWRPPWFEPGPDATPATLALHEKMLAGKAPSAFRALGSHVEGAAGLVRLLERPGFAPLKRAAESGDATAYARAVVSTGYCTDRNCQPDRMAPKLVELVSEFRRDKVFQGLELAAPVRRSSSSGAAGFALLVGLVYFVERRTAR